MRCHQNQINLKSGIFAPDAPCRLLFLPPDRPTDRTHTLTHVVLIRGRICGPLSGVSSPVYMHNCVSPSEGKHNSISVTKSILLLILSGHAETPIKANKAQTCYQIYIIYLFPNHYCIVEILGYTLSYWLFTHLCKDLKPCCV